MSLFRYEAAAMPLTALFKSRWKRSSRHDAGTSDRRGDERYPAYQPVTIRQPGMSPVTGTLVNVSLGGAAIRFHGWVADVPEDWLTRLKPGDELQVDGLVGAQMFCRTVTADAGVLRVQFGRDDALRHKLRSMVNDFTGATTKTRKVDRAPASRLRSSSIADRSPDELRARAAEYREKAGTAVSVATVNSLMRLAERFEEFARQRESGCDTLV
jgi:hypothetical protein